MLVIVLLFVGLIVLAAFLDGGKNPSAMDEYCRLECKEYQIRDKSICC